MKELPMPADWLAEHTSDAAWRRAIIAAFRVPAHLLYPNSFVIIDMTMPHDSMSLVAENGETVRMMNIGTGGE